MKNKIRKNQQFEFFSMASRTRVARSPKGETEKYGENSLKQKRWFSIHFIKASP